MSAALVTGATGMLGSYLVERLIASGWRVRALVRQPTGAGWLESVGAGICLGDVTVARSVSEAARGCDVIFHAAAAIGAGPGTAPFEAVNGFGTENVVEAAAVSGARLVHVSSTAVYGASRYREVPTDERHPLPALPAWDAYGRSKQDAERIVLAAHRTGRVWATVVRPPVMYGRRDRQFVPRVAPLLQRGVFPLVGVGANPLPLVHAAAVADGACRAAGCDHAAGQVYLLTDDHVLTPRALALHAAEGLGVRVRLISVPAPLPALAFGALALSLRASRRPALAAHATGTVRMLSRENPFTSARARTELGWSPSLTPAEGVPDAFAWWARERSPSEPRGRR